MKCRTVTDEKRDEFILTENEEKYIRALERLSRMDSGRLFLFGMGELDIRIDGNWAENSIVYGCGKIDIVCEGGDGGDYSEEYHNEYLKRR